MASAAPLDPEEMAQFHGVRILKLEQEVAELRALTDELLALAHHRYDAIAEVDAAMADPKAGHPLFFHDRRNGGRRATDRCSATAR